MLVHLRLTVPTDLSSEVRKLLEDDCTTNLVIQPGVCVVPEGDLIECDVAREAVSEVLDKLLETGLGETGGIVCTTPDSVPFAAAARMEAAAPGDPEDAVIWSEVRERAVSASRPTVTHHVFLTLAIVLAAIAVVTDSAVLVVGAMVVGPEFASIAAVATGLVFRDWRVASSSLRLLVLSFAFGVGVVTLLALVAAMTGLVTPGMLTAPRPQTSFIWHPDIWSFIVAVVAGAAGVLALSTNRGDAMVGVFISVTTVPAAGNLALAIALWVPSEMRGAAAQLGVNLVGMVMAGVVVLTLQRLLWKRVVVAAERVFALGRPARSVRSRGQV